MAFAIMRLQKVKGGLSNLARVRQHHQPERRDKIKNREHREREKYNRMYEKDGKTLHTIGKELLRQHQEITGRKARSDTVIFFEVLTTVSPELEKDVLANINEWIRMNQEWMKKEFPTCSICMMSIEFDESTVHLHSYLSATDKDGKLNARAICGKRQDYEKRQESYENTMRQLFPNIEKRKPKKTTNKKHKSVRQYWQEEDKRLEDEHKAKMQKYKEEEDKIRNRIKEEVFEEKSSTKTDEKMFEADDLFL